MGDVRGRATVRALCALVLVVSLALSMWTLAPLRSAPPHADEQTRDPPTAVLGPEIYGPAAIVTVEPVLNIDAAISYAAGRGLVGVAVLDRYNDAYLDNGVGAQTPIGSASVIKVVLAEELLYRAWLGQIQLGPSEYNRLESMLISSDDAAASSLYSQFGGVSLIAAAISRHELKQSAPPADPRYWGNTKISAHDVVAFYDSVLDGSLPSSSRDYLFGLLRRIAPIAADGFGQVFGLAALDPSWAAAVKQGWMCCLDGVRDVHSTAVLGRYDRYIVVILSRYSPSLPWEYGLATTTDLARIVVGALTF